MPSFLISARAGSGVVVAKTEDGRWSAPAAIGIGGLGGGFNAGAEVTDFLIVLNSKSAVRSFMQLVEALSEQTLLRTASFVTCTGTLNTLLTVMIFSQTQDLHCTNL